MKRFLGSLIPTILCLVLSAQVPYSGSYNKEVIVYKSKSFLMHQVLGTEKEPVRFETEPLASASSGELTTLSYKSPDKNKEGLILGFFGSIVNQNGIQYIDYGFKDLIRDKAVDFLIQIEKNIGAYEKYINLDGDHNVYFQFEDVTVLITMPVHSYKIRVFWKDFDSEWDYNSYLKTKKRFDKYMNKK